MEILNLSYSSPLWLVSEMLSREEQSMEPKMPDKKPATKTLMFSAGCMVSLYIKKQVCARVLKAGNIHVLIRLWLCSVGEVLLCYNP